MDVIDFNEEKRAREIDGVIAGLACSEKTGKPYNTPLNLEYVLKVDPYFGQHIRRNEFTGESEWKGAPLTDEGATFSATRKFFPPTESASTTCSRPTRAQRGRR